VDQRRPMGFVTREGLYVSR